MVDKKTLSIENLKEAILENNNKIKDYVLQKTDKINQINIAQKTVNTELDYGIFEIGNTITNATTPIVFSSVISGNMELNENGYIKLKKGKTYFLHINLYNVVYTSGIFFVSMPSGEIIETLTSAHASFIYNAKEDIEVSFRTEDSMTLDTNFSSVNVHEINRKITIDPVEYINTTHGIEDVPIGHIIAHMGTTAPKHYLICDGTEYGIMDYPYLAQHIQDNFGLVNYFGGDGVDTFAVPDLRGEFLRGTGTATRNIGSGSEVGIHQDPTLLQYMFTTADGDICVYEPNLGKGIAENADYISYGDGNQNGYRSDGTSYSTEINLEKYSLRPTNTSVLYCIKYEPTYFMQVQRHNTNYLSPTLYSQEERVIGSWINGKPLYEKTFIDNIPNTTKDGTATTKTIDTSELNIDICISQEGFLINENRTIPIPFATSANYKVKTWYENGICINNEYKEYSNLICYITIQYTKTTDEENSFTNDMIKDYIVSDGNSGNNNPNYGPSSGSNCNCPTYTDEEVDIAIDEVLSDKIEEEIIEEEIIEEEIIEE